MLLCAVVVVGGGGVVVAVAFCCGSCYLITFKGRIWSGLWNYFRFLRRFQWLKARRGNNGSMALVYFSTNQRIQFEARTKKVRQKL
jgi:hypothetical protein